MTKTELKTTIERIIEKKVKLEKLKNKLFNKKK